MANIKSSIKRIKVSDKKRRLNRKHKNDVKATTRKFNDFVEEGNKDEALSTFRELDRLYKRAALKNIVSKNKSRKEISKLQKTLNAI